MKTQLIAALIAASTLAPVCAVCAFADDQPALDACIASWGHASPFKKGTAATKVIATGVKVFGIGSNGATDEPTAKPSLVLVRPAVNVTGKSKIRLENPHGWYCFVSRS